jgi:hypothetical protein
MFNKVKQAIRVGRNATDIMRLPCVLSCHKQADGTLYYYNEWGDVPNHITFKTPRKAFGALIDRISGKGTWERNPWVYAYEFELVQ